MRFTHEHLLRKGWNSDEATRALRSFEHAETVKHPALKFLDKIIYWVLILIAVVGNLVLSIFLVPFILFIQHPALYAIAAILGLSFGALFTVVIKDMDHLHMGHHVLTIFIVPITAFVNFFLVVAAMSRFAIAIPGMAHQNPGLVSFIYSVGFLLPYTNFLLGHSLARTKKKNAERTY
tara:strand:- start:2771 stop:3304 length:534 start_codon:yes stop_codon:yes gene_type:complete